MVNSFKNAKQYVRIAEPQINVLLDEVKTYVGKTNIWKARNNILNCIKHLEEAEKAETRK